MATASSKERSTKSAAAGADFDHGQRRNVVVEQLLADIFQGRLKAGERLVIQNLATRFGVSPTPIREALVTLEGIGILDMQPNRGAVVRRVTQRDVKEVCQVRRALECAAVRLACGRIALTELRQLAAEFQRRAAPPAAAPSRNGTGSASVRKSIEAVRVLDSRLHDLISESCGNEFLSRELGRLKLLFRTFRDASWDRRQADNDLPRFEEEAREHLAIVEALLQGDPRAAAKAMSRHIRSGVKYWSRGLPR